MPELKHKLITTTPWKEGDDPRDAVGMIGEHWDISDCIIDLTDWPQYKTDEACGITRGASATFTNCVIRGVGKAILCGSGDEEDVPAEEGRIVRFNHCIIENFCRRGPEVQDGMIVQMHDCMVTGWGYHKKFDTRVFGAWAHDGGKLYAENCLFMPKFDAHPWDWLKDHWNHFWQCVNERGFFRALFHRDAWLSGYKRALTAGVGGSVAAVHCYASDNIVIDNHANPMTELEAIIRFKALSDMKDELAKDLGWEYVD